MVNLKGKLVGVCAATAAFVATLLILGCSMEFPSEDPAPASNSDRERDARLERPQPTPAEIIGLAQDAADAEEPGAAAATTVPVAHSALPPAATPDEDVAQQDSETTELPQDICGRNPELQWAIIERLKISSCQVINASELFRLRELRVQTEVPLQAGDFADIPNLTELEVRSTQPLPADVFVGLDGLRRLSITLYPSQSVDNALAGNISMIEPHTFSGLGSLQSLNVTVGEHGYIDLRAQSLAGLAGVQKLELNQVRSVGVGAFANLPELKYLNLKALRLRNESTGEYLAEQKLGQKVFSKLPALKGVSLSNFELSPTTDFFSPAVLCELPSFASLGFDELEAVTIGGQPAEVLQTWDWDEDNCLVEVGSNIVKVEKPDDWDG